VKILFVDLDRGWRGGQSQALLTLCGLRERKHQVVLLAPRNAPLARRANDIGIETREVSGSMLRLRAALAIHRLVTDDRFELIHLNEPHALTAAWLAQADKHCPLLLSRRIGFALQKNVISRARFNALERFLANSEEVARSLRACGISAGRISIVNEGVEIQAPAKSVERDEARQRWGVGEDQFLFGCVSVFVPEKGQRHLLDALALVRAQHPNARLILAGDGPCRHDLEVLASQLKLQDAVIFAGFVEDIATVYAALDGFAFPSEFEGLGTALQTAMGMGLPCVSTARGGLAEVVEHERSALVAEPDGPEFASAMLRIMEDKNLRLRLGESARLEIANRFSAARMVDNTIKVYGEVLRERRAV
jgi:glycosyltransferase involved in cell wall biosynthesis